MTESELAELEARIGFAFPAFYRATLVNYPFPPESYAEEFLLPNDSGSLAELNDLGVEIPGIGRPFFVGSDGGEEAYFVDASEEESPVYVFELETGNHRLLVASWPEYLEHVRRAHDEIEADAAAERERKRNETVVGVLEIETGHHGFTECRRPTMRSSGRPRASGEA